jgi:tRNA(Ile)-lysidine synthase
VTAPDPALVARFRRDFEELAEGTPGSDRRLGVAVSGGADSLALLLLAAAAYPGSVAAATVDHGLRPEAAGEAAFVGRVCRDLSVPHDVLTVPSNLTADGNLQDRARAARYALLQAWGGSGTYRNERPWRTEWVTTAHHRDDVAEGFLMRARRGAGVGGLAAMAAAQPFPGWPSGPRLIRPLLGWSHGELAGVVAAAGIVAMADPSNIHPRFDRSRIRQLIASSPDLPPDRLAMAAHNLRHAEDALSWVAAREWDVRSEVEDFEALWLDVVGLPYELRRRLTLRAIEHVRFEFGVPGDWSGAGLDRLVAGLDSGVHGTLAGVAARAGPRWRFELAPPRRSH